MTARRVVWEVARREIRERVRTRALQVSFVVGLLVVVAGSIAAARLTDRTPTDDVGLVGARSVALAPAIQARAGGRKVKVHLVASRARAVSMLHGGDLDAALVDGRSILVDRDRATPAVGLLQGAVAVSVAAQRLHAAGLTDAEAARALTPPALRVDVLEKGAREHDRNRGLLTVGMLVLFMALIAYGNMVASSVTEEKNSRVVEVILTTVPPRRLLAGKVLGIGALGLAQLIVVGGAALAAGGLAGGIGLPSAAPKAIGLVVLWFVLGYAFYSVVFGAVGALVSRQEDLQATAVPVTMLMVAAFYAGLGASASPNATLVQIGAFVPPLSPMLVPARVVLGDMGPLALVAVVILQLLAIAGMIALSARIYERAILQTGAPVRLRRLLGASRGLRGGRAADMLATVVILTGAVLFVTNASRAAAVGCLAAGMLIRLARARRGAGGSGASGP